LEGVLWLIGSAILSGISSGLLAIILFFAGAFVNPYLVYKRYKKILLQCDSQKMTYDQKSFVISPDGKYFTIGIQEKSVTVWGEE
jgi:hypothetical protein